MRDSKITSKERLEHILNAISDIESFVEQHSKKSFLNNSILIHATLFQFAVIGEAITHIDTDLLDKYPYPWYKARAFRNFILHEYHAIEFRIVWDSTQKDLPQLKEIVQQILKNEFLNSPTK
jgi:uncharacterized protein with HEPN domain